MAKNRLDPIIALAVGDADFQKKCLDKISRLKKEGKTILFVSHDMDKINQVCSRVINLEQGKIVRPS